MNYDAVIYYIDPGFYLPVLCIDKTGKILIVSCQWSTANRKFRIEAIHSPFTIHNSQS